MRERSLPVRNVQNVSEAIELAEQFHANGLVDLYRGQSGDWPISTTIQRINSGEQQCEAERTDAFVSWIMTTPELSSLHWDEDAILAVAQHYGIATPFLDVSVSARVAAYFAATDAPSNVGQSSHGIIFCFQASNIEAIGHALARQTDWKHLGMLPLRVVRPKLRSLWRLEAQQGAFIDVRIGSKTFMDMVPYLTIRFPHLGNQSTLPQKTVIFPVKKSHTEQMLDQFFRIEEFPRNQGAVLAEMFPGVISLGSSGSVIDTSAEKILPHESWRDQARSWQVDPDQPYSANNEVPVTLHTDTLVPALVEFERLKAEIVQSISFPNARTACLRWEIRLPSGEIAKLIDVERATPRQRLLTNISVGVLVGRAFDGMRSKPFTDPDIVSCLAAIVLIASRDGIATAREIFGEACHVEFEGGAIRGRGLVSESRLLQSARDDIANFVTCNFDSGYKLLSYCNDPRRMLDFSRFSSLFATQIIPTQLFFAVEGEASVFNPAAVTVLGLP